MRNQNITLKVVPQQSAKRKRLQRLRRAQKNGTYLTNAWCLPCRVPTRSAGTNSSGVKRLKCPACGIMFGRTAIGYQPERIHNGSRLRVSGEELMRFIDSQIVGYSIEMREELRGAIALAIIGRKKINGKEVSRRNLTAADVRVIAKPIYRTQPNRFREVSLEHCYSEDGYKLEERLAG